MAYNGSANLIPQNKRTKSEQIEIARKGGIASGESRRKRKTFKEQLLLMLETDPNLQNDLLNALIKRAKKTGDKSGMSANKAFELIRETIGEAPVIETKTTVEVEDLTPIANMLGLEMPQETTQESQVEDDINTED